MSVDFFKRLFLSSLVPLFQNESKCEIALMKMSLMNLLSSVGGTYSQMNGFFFFFRFDTEAKGNLEMA